MSRYFAYDYTGGHFELFGTAHLVALAVVLALCVATFALRGASERVRLAARWAMAILLWADEASWHLWNLYWGHWTVTTMVPLHACSALVWLAGFMLIFRDRRIYEFAYFLGIGGALQALLTPDAGIYGFPHYRVFQTIISHGALVLATVYMTVVEGFRPTWKSFRRVVIGINVYMALVFPVNLLLGTNFLYINRKPETASLLDLLPEWPVYIVFMELIGLAVFLLLYLPFAIGDWRKRWMSRDEGCAGRM
jgi:hypothetical integral membrane protein (TIGR02206 family)